MDILFLGGIFNEDEVRAKSKGTIQNAANNLQWNIIKGLDACNGKPVSILNAVFVGSYPNNYQDLMIRPKRWSHTEDANDRNVGFCNLPGIRHISRASAMAGGISDWAGKDSSDKHIVAYSVHTPFLYAIKRAKKINPRIKSCLVVPDLPQHMNLRSRPGSLYLLFKSLDVRLASGLLKYIDSYVLLTRHMAKHLRIYDERKYIVIEGMVSSDDLPPKQQSYFNPDDTKKVVYTGTLNWKYGIKTLLESFEHINSNNYRLQICGSGEAEAEIRRLCSMDSRVEFLGSLTREAALQLQREATVLVNPRNADGEFTKYSFPSKNMEYLLSGRPTLGYKLPGIPDDYEPYMYYIQDNTSISMANKIVEICEQDEANLANFGRAARDFVINEKNNIKQARKIVDLLKQQQ